MIINYAWANPITGLREQTLKCADWDGEASERYKAQARAALWDELQGTGNELLSTGIQSAVVHQQTHIGTVTPGDWKVEGAVLEELEAAGMGNPEFAWCDPWTGKRMVSSYFPTGVADRLKDDPREFCKELWIYAILASHPVRRDEPRPEVPEVPAELPSEQASGNPSIIGQKKAGLDELVTLGEPAIEIAKVTAWALLDIAESLRSMASVQIEKAVPVGVGPITSPFTSNGNQAHPSPVLLFNHSFEPSTSSTSCCRCGCQDTHPIHAEVLRQHK